MKKLICVLLVLGCGSVQAASISVTPSVDALGKDFDETAQFQTLDFSSLSSNNRQVGYVPPGGATQPQSIARSVFEFDLGGLGGGLQVDSATLYLEGYAYGTDIKTIEVYGYSADGLISSPDFFQDSSLVASFTVEGGLEYTGGIFNDTPGPEFSVELDVTTFISSLYDGSSAYAGFMLRIGDESNEFEWVDIHGTTYPGGGLPPDTESFPLLSVQASVVPIPAAVWLFGSGLGLLGFLRRRRLS